MLVKRRKRDTEKDLPFGVAREVGRKVGVEDKVLEGWNVEPKKDVLGIVGTTLFICRYLR